MGLTSGNKRLWDNIAPKAFPSEKRCSAGKWKKGALQFSRASIHSPHKRPIGPLTKPNVAFFLCTRDPVNPNDATVNGKALLKGRLRNMNTLGRTVAGAGDFGLCIRSEEARKKEEPSAQRRVSPIHRLRVALVKCNSRSSPTTAPFGPADLDRRTPQTIIPMCVINVPF